MFDDKIKQIAADITKDATAPFVEGLATLTDRMDTIIVLLQELNERMAAESSVAAVRIAHGRVK